MAKQLNKSRIAISKLMIIGLLFVVLVVVCCWLCDCLLDDEKRWAEGKEHQKNTRPNKNVDLQGGDQRKKVGAR